MYSLEALIQPISLLLVLVKPLCTSSMDTAVGGSKDISHALQGRVSSVYHNSLVSADFRARHSVRFHPTLFCIFYPLQSGRIFKHISDSQGPDTECWCSGANSQDWRLAVSHILIYTILGLRWWNGLMWRGFNT